VLRFTVLLSETVNDVSLYFNVHCTIVFYLRIITVANRQYTTQTYELVFLNKNVLEWVAYWSKNNTFILNTSLYIQEDISPWKSRLRRSQVSYLLSLCSYLQTLIINVFYSDWRFRISAKGALFVFCVCFVLFVSGPAHILCLTVASGWNKERCIPKYCDGYVKELFFFHCLRACC